ncbi:hypothetical protein PM082_018502 [Marasmius tenuissimus]|nr:hypothetical protein PM082_018502 [Marasmius tenuissimus]
MSDSSAPPTKTETSTGPTSGSGATAPHQEKGSWRWGNLGSLGCPRDAKTPSWPGCPRK